MTGLEKILKVIEDDANAHSGEIIRKAQNEADEIIKAAKQEADRKCSEMTVKSDTDVQAVLSRAESAAVLQEKKKLLDAKQQIISNVISKARNSLAGLSDSEYIDIILKMVKKYAHNKEGMILFSQTDKKRMPVDISSMLSVALAGKPGAALVISESTAPIDGGFVLKYGDIEENCSFDALFSSAKEELSDQVNAILFE
jgi:V/A-type H+-transporting ATPase subunit E